MNQGFCQVVSLALVVLLLGSCGSPSPSGLLDEGEGLSMEQFMDIGRGFDRKYAPRIAEEFGAAFSIRLEWENDRQDAWAAKSGNTWRMWLFGGLARNPQMTEDGYTTIVCHEMGHFLGGEPLKYNDLAAEAQADWYATKVCLPDHWQGTAPLLTAAAVVPEEVLQRCSDAWNEPDRVAICKRSLIAAQSTLNALADNDGEDHPDYTTPDDSVPDETILGYPSKQCRLDTFLAGALDLPRPACWFRE